MWTEHCKMLLNEYRLNPARREDQEVIVKQLEMFFFGEGSAKPQEDVPPAQYLHPNTHLVWGSPPAVRGARLAGFAEGSRRPAVLLSNRGGPMARPKGFT